MTEVESNVFPGEMRTIQDFQVFHQWLDEKKAFDQDIDLQEAYLKKMEKNLKRTWEYTDR